MNNDLLTELSALGVRLEATPEGALRVSPRSRLTPQLVETLKTHKQALLSLKLRSLQNRDKSQ
jgi:hypothetical protein